LHFERGSAVNEYFHDIAMHTKITANIKGVLPPISFESASICRAWLGHRPTALLVNFCVFNFRAEPPHMPEILADGPPTTAQRGIFEPARRPFDFGMEEPQ
jgi:hypothetical protein